MFAEINVGKVAFNAELRVVNPVRSAETQGNLFQALAEDRHDMQAASKVGDKGAKCQWFVPLAGIEEIDASNVHRCGFRFQIQERGIQFRQLPHQRAPFGVGCSCSINEVSRQAVDSFAWLHSELKSYHFLYFQAVSQFETASFTLSRSQNHIKALP